MTFGIFDSSGTYCAKYVKSKRYVSKANGHLKVDKE